MRLFLVGIVFVSIIVGLMSLPVWRITSVVVEGNRIVSKNAITAAAGISNDENIFFIRYKEVARRIRQIPQIKKVNVSGHLPSGVLISVEERKPFAAAIIGSRYVVMDKEGVILTGSGKGTSSNESSSGITGAAQLPAIMGLSPTVLRSGSIDAETMTAISKSLDLLSKKLDKSKFEIEMLEGGRISVLIDDVLKVKLGLPDEMDEKLFALSKILEALGEKRTKVEYIDVRSPSSPAVKFR